MCIRDRSDGKSVRRSIETNSSEAFNGISRDVGHSIDGYGINVGWTEDDAEAALDAILELFFWFGNDPLFVPCFFLSGQCIVLKLTGICNCRLGKDFLLVVWKLLEDFRVTVQENFPR